MIFTSQIAKNIKKIADEDCKLFVFDAKINSYVFYTMVKKLHINIFCNVFLLSKILLEYEKEKYLIKININNEVLKHVEKGGFGIFGNIISDSKDLVRYKLVFIDKIAEMYNLISKPTVFDVDVFFFDND